MQLLLYCRLARDKSSNVFFFVLQHHYGWISTKLSEKVGRNGSLHHTTLISLIHEENPFLIFFPPSSLNYFSIDVSVSFCIFLLSSFIPTSLAIREIRVPYAAIHKFGHSWTITTLWLRIKCTSKLFGILDLSDDAISIKSLLMRQQHCLLLGPQTTSACSWIVFWWYFTNQPKCSSLSPSLQQHGGIDWEKLRKGVMGV